MVRGGVTFLPFLFFGALLTHVAALPLEGEEEGAEGFHHLGEEALMPRDDQDLALEEQEGQHG
jgi:hypothetical protein